MNLLMSCSYKSRLMENALRCFAFVLAAALVALLMGCASGMDVQSEPPAFQRGNPAKKAVMNTPQPMQRGVAQGMRVEQYNQFNMLQKYGVYLADSREGTHVILPGDRLFVRTVPDVVIQPDFYVALNDLVKILNAYPHVKIAVIGHTSDVMSARMQAEVSLDEARVVSDYLTAAGVNGGRISRIEGMSSRQPISEQNDYLGRQLNRRVEVIVNAPLS